MLSLSIVVVVEGRKLLADRRRGSLIVDWRVSVSEMWWKDGMVNGRKIGNGIIRNY